MRCEIRLWRRLFFSSVSVDYPWGPAPSRPALHQRAKSVKANRPALAAAKGGGWSGGRRKSKIFVFVATQLESLANPAREHGKRGKESDTQREKKEKREKKKSADRRCKPAVSNRVVSCRVVCAHAAEGRLGGPVASHYLARLLQLASPCTTPAKTRGPDACSSKLGWRRRGKSEAAAGGHP